MKKLIGKTKLKSSNLPKKITVNKVDLFDERIIELNLTLFLQISRVNWWSKIPNASTKFKSYINKPDSIMETKQLSMKELKDPLFYLRISKSPSYDGIKKCFSSLCEPLKYLFNL